MHKLPHLIATAILVAGLFAATPAPAQDVVVNGKLWLDSTPDIRKAFLLGAGSMMAMESAYAIRKGAPQPSAGAMTQKAIEGMTLDQLSERITRWYQANPQRHDVPVMGVVWIDIVKPATSGH